ncbi:MAG TPA: MmgE/PrpD family protein [Bryobacteraceae bacterium]|nr:MmgE/PrpD family protein [Bryobacteraceae bacterium]
MRRGAGQERAPAAAVELARVLNRIRFNDLPEVPVRYAKMILASTLASAAAGREIGSARMIRDLSKEQGGRPEAPVWFDGAKLPVSLAARCNSMMSDAAASDDSDLRNVAHTGTCLTSTGLAVGERVGASGRVLLEAMVAGYEAAGRIGGALGQAGEAVSGSFGSGFHASIIVAFGGTATAGRLLRLTDQQMAEAVGITATSMGGLSIGTNSWAREYHAGNAALCAVNAALAASRGYTVNPDMLEARRGFLAVFAGRVQTAALTAPIGKDYQIGKYLAVKLVPGAHALQPAVEAAINVARESNAAPEEIAKILVAGPQIRVTPGSAAPKDMIEAIHSLPYFVASAVADRDFSWVNVTLEKIHRPVIARLIGVVESDPAPPPVHYNWNWGATVTLVTRAGKRFTSTVDAPSGSAPRGIEWGDIDAKYRALMPGSGLAAGRLEQVLRVIHEFERAKMVSELTGLLS